MGADVTSIFSNYTVRLPYWVLGGALLGVLAGVFFGDHCALLKPFGTAYVDLMEVVVFPYIICSLLHGLGRLPPATAWLLFRRSWLVFAGVWGITFLVIFLMSLSIPSVTGPSVIDATLPPQGPDLVSLLIPANPFFDLARNYVPAVVVFAILYGVAIQRLKSKETFLSVLAVVRDASLTIWRGVVLLAPIGVFALFANIAGTVRPDDIVDLSLYLFITLAGTLILAFWILPSVIAAFSPLSTREVLAELQSGIVIALITSLSVAALPFIQQAAEKLADRLRIEDEERGEIIGTTLAISYPFGQLGNFFIWLFVLFCAYYYRVPIGEEGAEEYVLPFVSLLSGIGSPTSSVNSVAFLSDWLLLPEAATGLYVSMMTITRYGQVLASVAGFAFITFLTMLNYYGKLRLNGWRLIRSTAIGMAIIAVLVVGGRYIENVISSLRQPPYLSFALDDDIVEGVDVSILKPGDADPAAHNAEAPAGSSGDRALANIQGSGVLRVGYNSDIIPFSYLNNQGDLVGFDIAYVYRLARDLNVKLELIPFDWQSLQEDLGAGMFDMAVSGIYVTDDRLEHLLVSDPYFQSPVALIVRSEDADKFLSRESMQEQTDLTIGVFDDPVLIPLLHRLFPNANVKVIPNYGNLAQDDDITAAIWTLEQAKSWVAPRPGYTAVVPKGLGGQLLLAYLMPQGSEDLREFLNYWMRLQNANGLHDRLKEKWIDGNPESSTGPRWSIVRDVLGWEGG
jgi:Na+/H+-dicarboxylate symporter